MPRGAGKTQYILKCMGECKSNAVYVSNKYHCGDAKMRFRSEYKKELNTAFLGEETRRLSVPKGGLMGYDECMPELEDLLYLERKGIDVVIAFTPTADLAKNKELLKYLKDRCPDEFI